MATSKYGKKELEALWVKAGGKKALASTMAAIALAESGGNPNARNPEGPEHAEGLWQIKGQIVKGNPFDPEVSAANAVAKYNSQGLGAWSTYSSGAYKQYLTGANEGAGLSGIASGVLKGLEEKVKAAHLPKAEEEAVLQGAREAAATGEAHEGFNLPAPLKSVEQFVEAITTPSTWLRVAEGVGGVILFFVGLKTLTRGTAGATVVNQPVSAAKGVAKKATEAAAAAVIA
jgi:hypothetical protein